MNPSFDKMGAKVERFRAMPRSPETDRAYGLALLDAINRQNLARLHKAVAQSWRARDEAQMAVAYKAAMAGEDAPLVANIVVPSGRRR